MICYDHNGLTNIDSGLKKVSFRLGMPTITNELNSKEKKKKSLIQIVLFMYIIYPTAKRITCINPMVTNGLSEKYLIKLHFNLFIWQHEIVLLHEKVHILRKYFFKL